MRPGGGLNRMEVPLPRWVKHGGADKSPACSLSLNDCLISGSNLGFLVIASFLMPTRGETGGDVITSLGRRRTDEELGSN